MKKALIITCVSALVSIASIAQDAPKPRVSPEERAQRRTEKLAQKLELSKEQTEKIKALMTREIRQNEDMRRMMMERKKASKAELDKILDDKQRAKLDEMRKEGKDKIRDRIKERRTGRQNTPPPADNDEDLSEYMDDMY